MSGSPATVLMTADAVGGVWSYALGLCRTLPEIRFVLATLGPRPAVSQRVALARLANVALVESDFRLEWMAGGQADVAASCRWLDMLAERHQADLVHVNGFAQARLDSGRPVVVVAHSDVLSWWPAVHQCPAPAASEDYRRAATAGLAAAARVVMPTAAVLNDLRREYRLPLNDAAVIPNGIDIAAFPPSPKRAVIMAAGRVWDEAKNLLLLDSIAPQLSWPVEIAGETAHPENGIVRLRSARALGALRPSAMRRCLGEAAIYAAPARYEPFGLGILEAAAAGCALVLGDIASLRENWNAAAIFLPSDDAGQWQGTLARLIDDQAERERLASAAKARARYFTIETTALHYRALYRAVAGAPAAQKVA